MSPVMPPSVADGNIPPVPHYPAKSLPCGSVTFRHIARFLSLYAALVLTGFALAFFSRYTAAQIFGLGMIFPGGGFLAHADFSSLQGILHCGLAVFSLAGFVFSLFIWFATGNVLAPPVFWLFTALAAAGMRHGHLHDSALPATLYCAAILYGSGLLYAVILWLYGLRARRRQNAYLGMLTTAALDRIFAAPSSPACPALDARGAEQMRFLLDRALQPVHDFNGFEWLDQFQTAAVRYQINFTGYALSMAQATYLPAFSGYMHQAQQRLIEKLTDHRVWKYWALENLWGNLQNNTDPVARENIMFTGFGATQMVLYHAATGRIDFTEKGSFALTYPSGDTLPYDLDALISALDKEAAASPFHLIACEPNWIYPLCNSIGAAALKAQAPALWTKREENFRTMLENEFIDLRGRLVPCRSRYTGFALPAIGGVMAQALPCFFLNASLPDIAQRQWLRLRQDITDGTRLKHTNFWRIDTGNYRFSRAAAYSATALAAQELGDSHVAALCFEALEQECPPAKNAVRFYRPAASVWAHATEFLARSTRKNSLRGLIATKKATGVSPYISQAAYPNILVAGAHSDGENLEAVLFPGGNAGQQTITVSGLNPDKAYLCRGGKEEKILANKDGDAMIQLTLNGRIELELRPAA
jgi:hypothetical protein